MYGRSVGHTDLSTDKRAQVELLMVQVYIAMLLFASFIGSTGLQAGEGSGLNLLRSPSFKKKAEAAQKPAEGNSSAGVPAEPGQSLEASLTRDPVSISNKSVSLRDDLPVSRAQLLSGLGSAGNDESASPVSRAQVLGGPAGRNDSARPGKIRSVLTELCGQESPSYPLCPVVQNQHCLINPVQCLNTRLQSNLCRC